MENEVHMEERDRERELRNSYHLKPILLTVRPKTLRGHLIVLANTRGEIPSLSISLRCLRDKVYARRVIKQMKDDLQGDSNRKDQLHQNRLGET